jgi:hypothetical protein
MSSKRPVRTTKVGLNERVARAGREHERTDQSTGRRRPAALGRQAEARRQIQVKIILTGIISIV